MTFDYLRVLCGHETAKPDIMVTRWLTRAVGRQIGRSEALELLRRASVEPGQRWGVAVPMREVDHAIWRWESGRDVPQG